MCLLSNNIQDYYFIAQGKTTIAGVDDGEEMQLTDVRTGAKLASIQDPLMTGFFDFDSKELFCFLLFFFYIIIYMLLS